MMITQPIEHVSFSTTDALPGVEFLSASYERRQFAPHAHEEYGFGVVLGGLERFRYLGSTHLAGPGSVIAMNPEAVHTGGPGADGGWAYKMVYVPRKVMVDLIPGTMPAFENPVIRDPDLAGLLAVTLRGCGAADTGLAAQSALGLALDTLVLRHASQAPPDEPARDATLAILRVRDQLEGIAEGDGDVPSLTDLAEGTGLSPTRFLRRYAERHGLPPHAHLRDMRLRRARDLLRGGMTPADVAAATGFSDQSHLTRWFGRTIGISPATYARDVSAQ